MTCTFSFSFLFQLRWNLANFFLLLSTRQIHLKFYKLKCHWTRITWLEKSCCISGLDNDCHIKRNGFNKYFEVMVCQIYTGNSCKSVKNKDMGWRAYKSFQEYPYGIESDLNPIFLMAISVRRLQWNSPRIRWLPSGTFCRSSYSTFNSRITEKHKKMKGIAHVTIDVLRCRDDVLYMYHKSQILPWKKYHHDLGGMTLYNINLAY